MEEIKCPKCNSKEIKIDTYDYSDERNCSFAKAECQECHTHFNIFFEEDIEPECPECGYDFCSLGDPEVDVLNHSITYDAYCDECGESFYAEGTLNIIGIEEVK